MTVKELIEELKKFEPDMVVATDQNQPGPTEIRKIKVKSYHRDWDYRTGTSIDETTIYVVLI